MIDIIKYQSNLIELEQVKHLLTILRNDYFIELSSKLDNKSYEQIKNLDKYDYIDYLVSKKEYETLLYCAVDKLQDVINNNINMLNDYYKRKSVINGNTRL